MLMLMLTSPWLVAHADSGNALKLQTGFHHAALWPHAEFTHATPELNSISDVLRHEHSIHWRTPQTNELNLGFEAGEYWLRVRIDNTASTDMRLLSEVAFQRFDDFSLFVVNGDRVETIYQHLGRAQAFARRPVDHRHYIAYVTIPAQQQVTLYWHANAGATMIFPATLWQPDAFYEHDQINVTLFATSYGALLALAIYNLFIFWSTREHSYLFYVGFVLAQTWLIMADVGHIGQWVMPDIAWPRRTFHAAAFAISFCCFAQFTVEYLLLKTAAPAWRHYLHGLSWGAAALLMGGLFAAQPILEAIAVLGVAVLYMSAVVMAWRIRRHGIVNAGLYLVASFVLALSFWLGAITTLAVIPGLTFSIGYQAIGTTAMGLLFSLALADRIKESQRREIAAVSAMHAANIAKLAADAQARKAEIEIQAKNQFVATLSHEIRTPLNGVMGVADLLRETRLDPQQRDYVETIHNSGGLLLNVINDVLDYAKIDAGAMTLDTQPFVPDTLLDELTRIFGYLAKARNLDFQVSHNGDKNLSVVGDSFRLRQVLSNLLSNALKFTERGAIGLHMHVHKSANDQVELRFDVRDSGIGMTAEQQQRLFEPFSQADSSSSRRYGGTGLGLVICKRLLALMGGSIALTSSPGAGSLFTVTTTLPLASTRDDTAPGAPATAPAAAHSRFARLRVLVVEDNPVNVMVIRGMLATLDITPGVASDGSQAVALASETPYDLILMDCMMPTMDGYEATRCIRGIEHDQARKRSVIIALSAHALPEFRERAMLEGMDDYLTKPVMRDDIEGMLHKYFDHAV